MMTRPDVTIDPGALPKRFVELHLTELSSWSMGRKPFKDVRLNWPLGFDGPATLRIGFEVRGADTNSPSIRLTLPRQDDNQVLIDYMRSIEAQDREYQRRQAART